MLIRGMVDKFVYNDNIDHLDSAPYTRVKLTLGFFPQAPRPTTAKTCLEPDTCCSQHDSPSGLLLLLSKVRLKRTMAAGTEASILLSKVRLKRTMAGGTESSIPRMISRSFILMKATLATLYGCQNLMLN